MYNFCEIECICGRNISEADIMSIADSYVFILGMECQEEEEDLFFDYLPLDNIICECGRQVLVDENWRSYE